MKFTLKRKHDEIADTARYRGVPDVKLGTRVKYQDTYGTVIGAGGRGAYFYAFMDEGIVKMFHPSDIKFIFDGSAPQAPHALNIYGVWNSKYPPEEYDEVPAVHVRLSRDKAKSFEYHRWLEWDDGVSYIDFRARLLGHIDRDGRVVDYADVVEVDPKPKPRKW